MAKYLFDTNILLRLSDRISANYALARDATYILIDQGHKCCLTSQIIIEFWVVATRPTEVNGLGWTPERTKNQINQFLSISEQIHPSRRKPRDIYPLVSISH